MAQGVLLEPELVLGACVTEKGDGWEMRWCSCTEDGEPLGCFCPWHGLVSLEPVGHVITDPPYEKSSHTKQRTLSRDKTFVVDDLEFGPMDRETMLRSATMFARVRGWIIAFCEFEMLGAW